MAIELKIPSVGESITEIEIGQWLKAEGDAVSKDENIVAIESEKATVELPAPVAGTLSRIVKHKGERRWWGKSSHIWSRGRSPRTNLASRAKRKKRRPRLFPQRPLLPPSLRSPWPFRLPRPRLPRRRKM